jgi:lipopolysaccharide export system ATP-binding protein
MAVLKAKNLKKSFEKRMVVKGVDLEVQTGCITSLLGRNGAGKTTTFRMITGLTRADEGAVFLNEENISGLPTRRRADRGIIYLPQENSVFLKATVAENLDMILEMKRPGMPDKSGFIHTILKEMGLSELKEQKAYSLSGGERRRLEISRSLILDPRFLLLDEPFTGIDPLTIVELQKILLNLRKNGIGILVSDHNVRDTLDITDRGYVIDNGSILVEGTPVEISSSAEAREKFLGKNFVLGKKKSLYSSLENNKSPNVSLRKTKNSPK